MRKLLLVSLMAMACVGAACGGDDGGDTSGGSNGTAPPGCYGPPKDFDSTTPQVSFQADVFPVFRRSCGLTVACHGSVSGPNPYLGPALGATVTEADLEAIRTQNVGADSRLKSGMKRIAPGDPMNSFLMHKLDGDQSDCSLLECGGACGTEMPPGQKLHVDERDMIRRWIAQGAVVN